MKSVSILLCAHNPKPDFLARTLDALRKQTLPQHAWELLLVDNASDEPLRVRYDIGWHSSGRHLREEKLGKTNAFLLGLKESTGRIVLIVDDDNLLAPNYLEESVRIADAHPGLGAWGGNVKLCFEADPPDWTRPYWSLLAGRTVDEDAVVNNLEIADPLPVGAGCCLRREVAEHYASRPPTPWREALGRVGLGFGAGEDTDLILTACDLGMERGVFRSLHLDHLIPPQRLTEDYLLQMTEGVRFAGYMLELARHAERVPPPVTVWWHLKLAFAAMTKMGRRRRFFLAYKRAQKRAREYYQAHAPHAPGRAS